MLKSGIEFFILKSCVPLQSCCCPVQKNLPRKAELAWMVSRYLWRGTWYFKITFSIPLFTIIFKPKMVISRLKILVTYSSHSRWCELFAAIGNPIRNVPLTIASPIYKWSSSSLEQTLDTKIGRFWSLPPLILIPSFPSDVRRSLTVRN